MSDLVLVFTGQSRVGFNLYDAQVAFGKSFSLSSSQVQSVLERAPLPVKKGLDKTRAYIFVKTLWKLGWHSEIRRSGKVMYRTKESSAASFDEKTTKAQIALEKDSVNKSLSEKKLDTEGKGTPIGSLCEQDTSERILHLSQKLVSDTGELELYVPGSWHEATRLNELACIQAGCVDSDAYLVVVPQRKDEIEGTMSVENYANEIIEHATSLVSPAKLLVTLTKLDHPCHTCFYAELVGTSFERQIRYVVSVFESEKNFYALYIWALQEKVEELKTLMQTIIRSSQIV